MARGTNGGAANTGASVNFSDLAQIKATDVSRPTPLPAGHYLAQITGPMTEHKAAKSGNVAMRFPCQILGPGEDVDTQEYDAALTNKDGSRKDPPKFNMDFWMSPDARYRFTDFACKVQGASDSMNLIELAEYVVGEGNKPFSIQNKPRQSDDDPDLWFNNFDNPTSAD